MRRVASPLAIAGASVYLVTLLAAPLLDRSIDVLTAYPEDYAAGPAGPVVRLGYLAVALMAFAIAASLDQRWVSRIAAAFLAAGSVASLALAVAPQRVTGGVLAAAVLCLVAAPLLVSLGTRRERSGALVAFGVIVTFAFVALAVAPDDIAGITNRAWDVMLGAWGLAFAVSAAAPPRASAVARGGGGRPG